MDVLDDVRRCGRRKFVRPSVRWLVGRLSIYLGKWVSEWVSKQSQRAPLSLARSPAVAMPSSFQFLSSSWHASLTYITSSFRKKPPELRMDAKSWRQRQVKMEKKKKKRGSLEVWMELRGARIHIYILGVGASHRHGMAHIHTHTQATLATKGRQRLVELRVSVAAHRRKAKRSKHFTLSFGCNFWNSQPSANESERGRRFAAIIWWW